MSGLAEVVGGDPFQTTFGPAALYLASQLVWADLVGAAVIAGLSAE